MNKPVNGLLLHHKYAQQELLKSLIRTANHMDNIEKDDLRVLADHCIKGLNKEAFDLSGLMDGAKSLKSLFQETGEDVVDVGKGALIGGAVGGLLGLLGGPFAEITVGAGIAGGAAVGAAVSAIFSTGPAAKNVSANSQEAYDQIEKLISDFPDDNFLKNYSKRLLILKGLAEKYEKNIDNAQLEHSKIQNSSKQKHETLSMRDSDNAKNVAEKYIENLNSIKIMIADFISNVNRNKYENNSSPAMGRLEKILVPFKALFGGTVHDAQRASQQLERVVDAAIKGVNEASSHAEQAAATNEAIANDDRSRKQTIDPGSLDTPNIDKDVENLANW